MLDEAIDILRKQTNIETSKKDWSFESVTAEREELDPDIIQANECRLPALVMTHLFLYVEPNSGEDYVVFFVMDTNSSRGLIRGLLVEGKLAWSEV
ncbi:4'-phosphopantetheinyl transferase [Enterococcus pseudoavium]|uniref:4'-phosphopantetheinyl transferase n=1 Tax=Enterococcus pseudoavium TaxID=44007 RepID=UPI003F96121B